MNKTLLALMATSTFALSGCISLIGMGIGHIAEGKKATKEENAYAQKLHETYGELSKKYAELPTEIDELEKAWKAWDSLYSTINSYRDMDYFGSKRIGSCNNDKERAATKNCKEAIVLRGKVAKRIAASLHAGVDATPELGNDFPLWQIVRTQETPEIAKAVDVEATLGTLVPKLNEHWAKRAKKSGGAETLVRKANAGSCFFSNEPQSDLLKPRFAFSAKGDEMHIKCVAPQTIDSYERTQKDLVIISMNSGRYADRVETLPGNHNEAGQSFDVAIPVAKLRKAAKNKSESEDIRLGASTSGKPWRFAIVEVSYNTYRKVGTTAYHNGNGTSFKDDIRDSQLASGMIVLDLEGSLVADDEETVEAEEEEVEEAPKAKKSKSKKTQTAQRPRTKKSRSR